MIGTFSNDYYSIWGILIKGTIYGFITKSDVPNSYQPGEWCTMPRYFIGEEKEGKIMFGRKWEVRHSPKEELKNLKKVI